MQGQHTITLSDGKTIPLRFCTWTFNKFAEGQKLSFSGLIDLLASGEITGRQVVSLLLCAAEYPYVRENKQFHFSELDASEWIDDMGGLYSKQVGEIIAFAMGVLTPKGDEQPTAEATEKNAEASA